MPQLNIISHKPDENVGIIGYMALAGPRRSLSFIPGSQMKTPGQTTSSSAGSPTTPFPGAKVVGGGGQR